MRGSHSFQTAKIAVQQLSYGYADKSILTDLSVGFPAGKISVIVGPNGCGKSTLLNLLAGVLMPKQGEVFLDGQLLTEMGVKSRAKELSLLPQHNIAPQGIRVRELVERGRYAHQSWFSQWHGDDEAAVQQALSYAGLSELAERELHSLSGGQRQRAWIALVLAQQTPLLLLDEPTTFLDIGHQLEVLNVCKRLNQSRACTIVMVLHDLNLAAKYADYMLAMKDGQVVANGSPTQVYQPEIMAELFGIRCQVAPDPSCGSPMVIPITD